MTRDSMREEKKNQNIFVSLADEVRFLRNKSRSRWQPAFTIGKRTELRQQEKTHSRGILGAQRSLLRHFFSQTTQGSSFSFSPDYGTPPECETTRRESQVSLGEGLLTEEHAAMQLGKNQDPPTMKPGAYHETWCSRKKAWPNQYGVSVTPGWLSQNAQR